MLGADRPAGHQQRLAAGPGGGVGVDDAQVHPSHPARIRLRARRVNGGRDLGGDIGPQSARVIQQRDRPDLAWWVGRVTVQAHL